MKVKLLKNLTSAKPVAGQHHEPHGTLQHVAHFPHPGVICQLKLGAGGLQYQRGEDVAVIPTAELIALFEAAHPGFATAPQKPAPGKTAVIDPSAGLKPKSDPEKFPWPL